MPTCKNCGKHGLFLKLNARGLCADCVRIASMRASSNAIVIGSKTGTSQEEIRRIGHTDEESACNFFIDELVKRGRDREKFKIEHRSGEYTSLFYGLNDLIRIKMTENVNWISLALCMKDREKYKDSILFVRHEDKKQRHWRSYFNSFDDLKEYVDLAANTDIVMTWGDNRALTEKEKEILDYIVNLFIDCGANSTGYYLYILSNEIELIYLKPTGRVRIKVYTKKRGGYVYDFRFKEYGIKAEKDRLSFSELSDLDVLKKNYIPTKIKTVSTDTYSRYQMENYIRYK